MQTARKIELGEYGICRIAEQLVGMFESDMTTAERNIAKVFIDAGYCVFKTSYGERLFDWHPDYRNI